MILEKIINGLFLKSKELFFKEFDLKNMSKKYYSLYRKIKKDRF